MAWALGQNHFQHLGCLVFLRSQMTPAVIAVFPVPNRKEKVQLILTQEKSTNNDSPLKRQLTSFSDAIFIKEINAIVRKHSKGRLFCPTAKISL